jgi:putative flippase GtrA
VRALANQGARFLAVGLAALLLDWAVFSALHAVSTATIAPNVAGRIAGAELSFWLNGRFTFADAGEARLGTRRFARYVVLWLGLTALSTLGMKAVDALLGGPAVYWCKLPIEALMALLSFFISRHWVYE